MSKDKTNTGTLTGLKTHRPCRGTVGPCTPRPDKAPRWSTCIDSDSHHDMSNLTQEQRERGV